MMWVGLRWLGYLAGAISIFGLLKQGFEIGLTAPFQTMLEFYESWIQWLFWWMGPIFEGLRDLVNYWLPDLGVRLSKHWRHAPVLALLVSGMYLRIETLGGKPSNFDLKLAGFAALLVTLMLTFRFGVPTEGGIRTRAIAEFGLTEDGYTALALIGMYLLVSATYVAVRLLVGIALWSLDRDRPDIPRSDFLAFLRVLAGLAISPLLVALLFVVMNAGLKYAGVG